MNLARITDYAVDSVVQDAGLAASMTRCIGGGALVDMAHTHLAKKKKRKKEKS